MSTSITSSTDLMSAAEAAAKAAKVTNSASSSTTAASSTSSDALASLSSNYNQFLHLLTTQLQNQDPSSPMDSSSFTSELAQFAGVEQQVATNTNLTQLLSLNQDSQVSQGTSLVGRQAVATTSELPLQNGTAELQLKPTTAGPVAIAITNAAGTVVKTQTLDLSAGSTDWTWDGKDDSGNTLADGSYNVAALSASSGTSVDVPFSVVGTITGVTKNATNGVNVEMGATSIDMTDVTSLLGTSTSSATSSSDASTTS